MIEIVGKRIKLRNIDLKDYKSLLPIWNNEEIIKYTYQPYITNDEDCKNHIEWVLNNQKNNDFYYNSLVIEFDKKIIGIIGIEIKSKYAKEYELWYILLEKYWGKGFATEAVKTLLDKFLHEVDVERLYAEAVIENIASWKLLEKIGMKKEGCLRNKFFRNNIYKDLLVYSLLKNEYQYET